MNTAINNFYVIEPFKRNGDETADMVFHYDNSIDVTMWRGNKSVMLGKIVSSDLSKWVGTILGNSYSNGDLVVYDPSRVIKNFDDGTLLVRDDAIACLFNEKDNAPGANENQVVVKIECFGNFSTNTVVNGFCGTVIDMQIGESWNEKSNVHNVKIGDNVILVSPYKTGSECSIYVFTKISTTTGFYVIAELDAIACKLENEK